MNLHRIASGVAFAAFTIFAAEAGASAFSLPKGHKVHACTSTSSASAILNASMGENYLLAMAAVAGFETGACPYAGPFQKSTLNAEIIEMDQIEVGPFTAIALVQFHFSGSNRQYHSTLLRSADGSWSDAPDAILGLRTMGGILEWMIN